MLSRESLEFLYEKLHGFHRVETIASQSDLLALPPGTKLASLEEFQDSPNRIRQRPQLLSCDSFCAYINRFKDAGTSVYLDVDGGNFHAVLDHPDADAPAWRDHTASYSPALSLQWKAWLWAHKKPMTQIDLAQFIEERLDDITLPEPSVMLKAVLEFQSNEKLTLGSTNNLDDGSVNFNFSKDNVNKTVTFPHRFKLEIPIHENEEKVLLDARMRYRTSSEGLLSFTVSLVQEPLMIQRTATLRMASHIRSLVKDCALYEGRIK